MPVGGETARAMNTCTCTRSKVLTPRHKHLDVILIETTHAARRPSASHSQHAWICTLSSSKSADCTWGEQREDKWLSRSFACNFLVPLLCKPLARAELSRSVSPSTASDCSVLSALPRPRRLSPSPFDTNAACVSSQTTTKSTSVNRQRGRRETTSQWASQHEQAAAAAGLNSPRNNPPG